MGVTIHFEGRLRSSHDKAALVSFISQRAEEMGWPCSPINEVEVVLKRILNDQDIDYVGPVSGIEVHLHANCEPLRFEFDDQLYIQEWCKTQFAGADIHVETVDLIRSAAKFFKRLSVVDEGEYFETGDREVLQSHMDNVDEQMRSMMAKDPQLAGPVRQSSGRIADLVTRT